MIRWLKKAPKTEEITSSDISLKDSKTASLWQGLSKTRKELYNGIKRLFGTQEKIDLSFIEELETLLLKADVGVLTTHQLIDGLQTKAKSEAFDSAAAYEWLIQSLKALLDPVSCDFHPKTSDGFPFVILMVGINGAGKTTTIGKLASFFKNEGYSVMLAAGDTFRAAAIQQLKAWGEKNDIPVVAQQPGADSASVIYDAFSSAEAKKIDILIADTAGRLHTQGHLMEELKKIKRVLTKQGASVPHETMLVLDAGTGQNALNQAREFHEAIGITGITMTKLDGTAKGGILFSLSNELKIPIRFIGVGEGLNDLKPFESEPFIKALFSHD